MKRTNIALMIALMVQALFLGMHAHANEVASYVKLDFIEPLTARRNLCGGVLLSSNVVLTASYCVGDAWTKAKNASVEIQLGTQFKGTAGIYSLQEGLGWVRFDPDVDLAMIRLADADFASMGAAPARLASSCSTAPLGWPQPGLAYLRMQAEGVDLPREQFKTGVVKVDRIGTSVLANGMAFISKDNYAHPGDSGSPVFSDASVTSAQRIVFAIYNGSGSGETYHAALCLYADRINRQLEQWKSPSP